MNKNRKSGSFYAVAKGHGTTTGGIYNTRKDASPNTERVKKFSTLNEAEGSIVEKTGRKHNIEVLRSAQFSGEFSRSESPVCSQAERVGENRAIESNVEDFEPSCSTLVPIVVNDPKVGEFIIVFSPGSPVCQNEEGIVDHFHYNTNEENWKTKANKNFKTENKTGSISKKSHSSVNLELNGETLYSSYLKNEAAAEEVALSYLTTEIQHPVISCFREITKSDIAILFSSTKMRKRFNNLESSIVCLGLIDYLATCVNNPLYNESGKMSAKNIPVFVDKIIQEFKGILRLWGLNDQRCMQNRLDTIFSFLRRLIPCFIGIDYDKIYAQLIDTLENDIRMKKPVLKHSFASETDSEDTSRSALFELHINQNIFETEEESLTANVNPPPVMVKPKKPVKTKAVSIVRKSELRNQSTNVDIGSLNLTVLNIQESNTVVKNYESDDITILDMELVIKKPKLDGIRPALIHNVKGPPKNAFAIMMSRSREIAQQKRNALTLAHNK